MSDEPNALEVAAANYTRNANAETYEALKQAARDFVKGESVKVEKPAKKTVKKKS